MIPEIPLELVDIIFDKLHSDPSPNSLAPLPRKPALCACRLVRRSWASLAVSHLFRDICHSFSYSVERTLQVADRMFPDAPGRRIYDHHGRVRPLKTLRNFHDFLAASPGAQYSIRWLCLRGFTFDECNVRDCQLPAELLVATLNMLPNLQVLHLVDVALHETVGISIASHPRTRARVERPLARLSIRYLAWPYTQRQMIQTLSAFEVVEQLAVFPVRPADPVAYSEAGTLHARNLELTFGGNAQWQEGPLLVQLRRLLVLDYLRGIRILGSTYGPSPERQKFVDAVRTALEATAPAQYTLQELQEVESWCIKFVEHT